jgi:hypothetical protein
LTIDILLYKCATQVMLPKALLLATKKIIC